METHEQENFVDQLFTLLEQLLLPNWSDLFALLPWVLIALIVLFMAHTAWQWRRAAAINRSRVPPRLRGGAPPPGIHLPGPSRWPFVVPIGAALLLFAFALPARDEAGNVVAPFNTALLTVGLLVTLIAVSGWLWDAMREWRSTAEGGHGAEAALGAGHAPALSPGAQGGTAVAVSSADTALVPHAGGVVDRPAPPEPPPGVHMPGPSPWPFFAPIALTVMLFGVIFSSVLILGGLILGVIAAAGWYRDAGREYRSTEVVGHAVPETRDPERAWPSRLVPVFATVIAISLLVTLAPIGLGFLNGLTPPEATPTPLAVPAVPEIAADNAISFERSTLIVPAARPFELVFNNNDEGVPHNVEITQSSARETVLLDGEIIDGVASITYQVPALDEGSYYFLCAIHPNMNGTVQAMTETGAGPGAEPGAGGSPGPGATGAPGGQPGPGASPQPAAPTDAGDVTPAPQASPAS